MFMELIAALVGFVDTQGKSFGTHSDNHCVFTVITLRIHCVYSAYSLCIRNEYLCEHPWEPSLWSSLWTFSLCSHQRENVHEELHREGSQWYSQRIHCVYTVNTLSIRSEGFFPLGISWASTTYYVLATNCYLFQTLSTYFISRFSNWTRKMQNLLIEETIYLNQHIT